MIVVMIVMIVMMLVMMMMTMMLVIMMTMMLLMIALITMACVFDASWRCTRAADKALLIRRLRSKVELARAN